MNKEEKEAIKWFDTERKLVEITNGDNNYFSIILNYIDKLQKDNYKLDRENQHFFDRIQDLQKENKEAYHKGFIDGITSSKYIIGNKKEELEVQLEILLNDNSGLFTDTTIMLDQEINLLEELLEMIK